MKILYPVTFFLCADFTEERVVTTVFHSLTQRTDIRNGDIDIIGKESTVKHGGLAALADTCTDPFAGIQLFECLVDVMQVVSGILGSQVIPVARFGSRLQEITVLHKDQVGVQQLRQLFLIFGIEGIGAAVTFRYQDSRTIETDMTDNDTLGKGTCFRVLRFDGLGDTYQVLLRIDIRFELFDVTDPFQGGKLLFQIAR